MIAFASQEWLDAYREAVNADPIHREAAADWEGDVALLIEQDPDHGFHEDVWLWLDLHHGECRSAKVVDRDDGCMAAYIVSASYLRWKDVILGQLDPIRGMRQGKLKLKGDLAKIAEHVEAANRLVSLAASVPTAFPDA